MKSLHIFCLLLYSSFFTSTGESNWVLKYDKDDISVFVRETPSGLNEFKAITTIDANVQSVYSVITDLKTPERTKEKISDCSLLMSYSNYHNICYFKLNMPWPLSDRDLISESKTTVTPNNVTISMESNHDYINQKEDYIRIKTFKGHWKLERLDNQQTKAEFQLLTSPEKMPNWLVNMFLLDTPVSTLKKVKKAVQDAPFKDASYEWMPDSN